MLLDEELDSCFFGATGPVDPSPVGPVIYGVIFGSMGLLGPKWPNIKWVALG